MKAKIEDPINLISLITKHISGVSSICENLQSQSNSNQLIKVKLGVMQNRPTHLNTFPLFLISKERLMFY
jgi:hypothetical protein